MRILTTWILVSTDTNTNLDTKWVQFSKILEQYCHFRQFVRLHTKQSSVALQALSLGAQYHLWKRHSTPVSPQNEFKLLRLIMTSIEALKILKTYMKRQTTLTAFQTQVALKYIFLNTLCETLWVFHDIIWIHFVSHYTSGSSSNKTLCMWNLAGCLSPLISWLSGHCCKPAIYFEIKLLHFCSRIRDFSKCRNHYSTATLMQLKLLYL